MTETGNVETHLIDALRDYAQGEEPARDDDEAIVDAVLARLENEPTEARQRRRLHLGLTVSAAALASAAAVALWLAWPRQTLEEPTQLADAGPVVREPAPEEQAAAEPVAAPDEVVDVGDEVIVHASSGRACFRLGERPSRCIEPGTSVAVPLSFDSAPVVLTVVIGEIQLTSPDGVTRSIGAGKRAQLGGPSRVKVDSAELGLSEAAEDGVKARVPEVGDLLERALAQRTAGRLEAAARTYRELIRLHPRSSAARTALVSLGQLELADRPGAALRSFERYLESGGGVLREEASHGRIRALRRLGRSKAERTAIETYLIDHPDGMYSSQLRSRLATLVKEENP